MRVYILIEGKCIYMEFDNADGDTLALFQEKCSTVTVINIFTNKKLDLEINRKGDLTMALTDILKEKILKEKSG